MNLKKFAKEHGEVIAAYEKLRLAIGEDEALRLLNKIINKKYVDQ